jgi:predicted benzoate:H+ symporter BenE
MTPPERAPGALQPIAAGVVASLVGFASMFALVLAGLRAVGADVVSASSITAAGISAPFWGLVAGLAFLGLQRVGIARRAPLRQPA